MSRSIKCVLGQFAGVAAVEEYTAEELKAQRKKKADDRRRIKREARNRMKEYGSVWDD